MKVRLLLAVTLLGLAAFVAACAWDRDTLSHEAKGKLDIIDAAMGRIDRYPPIYYEMRIELAQESLKLKHDFSLYDDIAVAYDRLGKQKEAIHWMALKRKEMAARPTEVDDTIRYRTEANEGTFWAHKWYAEGRKDEALAEIQRGRDMIARAIEINPDAHFGREHVQLMIMDWSLESKKVRLWRYLDAKKQLNEKTKEGLIGLMVLGNAWENIEVLGALGSMSVKDNSVNKLIEMRIRELEPKHDQILGREFRGPIKSGDEANVKQNFDALRANAKQYQANLATFVQNRIKSGMHPDKDGDRFWEGYKSIPRIDFIDRPFDLRGFLLDPVSGRILLVALGVFLLVLYGLLKVRATKLSTRNAGLG